jgi:hypothetical protein
MRHFPVQYAWTRVAPLNQPTDAQMTTPSPDRLEMQIKRYQEWARLTRGRWGDDAVAADAFVDSHRLSAIVGGPGAGKTTLCKRLAFFTSEGRLVVYVRLGTVSALLGHGSTFENAMIEAGLESSGQLVMDRRHILASADLLIADGLDECDPRRADVAIDISRWAQSHPNTSICVLTRPVGHDPGLLPGFSHAELLPLDDDTIRDVASWMIESQCGAGRTPPLLHPFLDAVKEGHQIGAASIAARNPLFLSFLVRLFIDGQDINAKRNVLFSRIVELIRKSPPLNRASPEGQVDSATAWATAEITGWSCLTQPDRPVSEIYSLIARQLGGGIDVARRAESAVHLWTEHGLIELVTAGSLDAVVFVHPALGEYLAGRHLAQLDASDFTQAISDHRPKARWREPIVLAAGSGAAQRVVDTLLALDSPDDPESGEAFLAASAIAESEFRTVAEDAIEKVAAQLKLRLCSPIPLIAVDAGLAIAEVAPMIPEMAAAIALELWDHSQPWSRLAAICSGISGGSPSIPVGKIVEWIEQLKPMHFFSWGPDYPEWPSGTYKLQASALPNALKRIATELPASVAEKIVTAFLSRGDLASGLIDAAQSKLNEKPYSDWVYRARRQWIDSTLEFVQTSVKASQALTAVERTIQECIIRACGRERDTTFDRPSECRLIGTLLSSMEYWEVSLPDLKSVGTEASPVLVETLRGMIHALDLDPDKLSYEANWLLNRPLDTSGIPERSRWQAQQLKRDPDWRKARDSKPDVNLLADALQHPSRFVAWNAARLFAACGDAPSRRELLRNLMFNGQGWALRLIDMLASSVWGEEAFGEIHGRFGKPLCPGCGYLYKPMLRAAGNLEQVQLAVDTALNGAAFDDPRTAELAAEALRTVPAEVLAPHGSRALELLDIWKSRGSWCYGCKRVVPGSSCENCHIVPPQPREHLVYLAFKAGALNFQDLLKLANEEGFSSADAATKSLAQWAFTDPKIMREVIEQIDTESAPKQLIKEILGQPADQLRKNSDELLTLLNSHSAVARARIIESFSYGWVAADLAKTSAKNALEDVSPFVRSAAAKFLWAQSEI